MLKLLQEELSSRDCDVCAKWLFNEKTEQSRRPTTASRSGDRRPALSRFLHAAKCGAVAPGTPDAKRSLTPQNERCYQHYLQCKATNQWPDDAIVRINAGLIRGVEEQVQRLEQKRTRLLLEAALTMQ